MDTIKDIIKAAGIILAIIAMFAIVIFGFLAEMGVRWVF